MATRQGKGYETQFIKVQLLQFWKWYYKAYETGWFPWYIGQALANIRDLIS